MTEPRCQKQLMAKWKGFRSSQLKAERQRLLAENTDNTTQHLHSFYLACTGLRVFCVDCFGALGVRGGGRGAALGRKSRGLDSSSLLFTQTHNTQQQHTI